jgi:hypothetical protein
MVPAFALCFVGTLAVRAAEVAPAPAASPGSPPVTAPPAQAEVLEQLDEILVRGKRLRQVIIEAEDEFYELFNEVNQDEDYDTSCPTLNVNVERGAARNTRVCLPGFMATAMADWAVSKVECTDYTSHDTNMDGRMSYDEAPDHSKSRWSLLDRNGDRFLSAIEYADDLQAMTVACRQPPPPQLVLMERTRDWYQHMLKVTNSDPRLKNMAGRLDDLYRELMVEQSRLVQAKALQDENAPRAAPNLGPRVN